MKRTLAALAVAVLCSGCSSLNVSWQFNASYNTNTRTVTDVTHVQSEK